jgi:hypothetical protein
MFNHSQEPEEEMKSSSDDETAEPIEQAAEPDAEQSPAKGSTWSRMKRWTKDKTKDMSAAMKAEKPSGEASSGPIRLQVLFGAVVHLTVLVCYM